MYGADQASGANKDDAEDEDEADIETEIKKELSEIRKPTSDPLFTSIRLDTQCCKPCSLQSFNTIADSVQYCSSKHGSLLSPFPSCREFVKTLQMALSRSAVAS